MSESVRPENTVNTISQNRWREFHPILATDVFRFVDAPIKFWGQKVKVKVTASNDQKTRVNTVSS